MDAKILRLATAIVFVCLSCLSLRAQQPLLPGVTVNGSITGSEVISFPFSASEGVVLSFLAVQVDGQLDPAMTLYSSTGAFLVANDDYDYPSRTDALIEAFTVPRTGEYRLELRAVNDQGGAYRLTMFSGYPTLILSDQFDNDTDVQPIETGTALSVFQRNGELVMGVQGIDQLGVAQHPRSASTFFYTSVNVTSITHRNGWIVGMAVRIQPDGSRYQVEFDERGLWRMVLIQAEQRTILRDWTSHPAIRAGVTTFSMGVLAAPGGFDVFYDALYVGTVPTRAIENEGLVGFVVQSRNALDSSTQATFDNLAISVPVLVNQERVRPDYIVSGSPAYTSRQLHRMGLIPIGGEQVLDVAELTTAFTGTGVNEAPLARGLSVQNFVYSALVSITTARQGLSGCGILARRAEQDYVLAYTDNAGGYGLSVRKGDEFTQSNFAQLPARTAQVWLLMIGGDTHVQLFVDGRYFASVAHNAVMGTIGTAAVNFEAQDTTCRLRNVWLWRW